MIRKLLRWIISILNRLAYESVTLDKVNKKLIEPVEGLCIDGVQYYKFVNQADMPDARFAHFMQFRNELSMGADRTLINEYLDNIIHHNNAGNASRVGQLAFLLQDTINNCTPVEAFYNMASLMYFDKKEDISCYDYDYNQRKIEAFRRIKDQAFFLTGLLENLKDYGFKSPKDINRYLTESMVRLKTYARILTAAKESSGSLTTKANSSENSNGQAK